MTLTPQISRISLQMPMPDGRRGSMKRGSITILDNDEDEEERNLLRKKQVIEAITTRQKQKAFTWDNNETEKTTPEDLGNKK